MAEDIIFVRDIYKVWCINGINSKVNSQDKLAELLKKMVGDREVVTVGSSAGGYMAILFGIILHASSIYALSPQVNLHEYNKDHEIDYYNEWVDDSNVLKYMNLKSYIDKYTGNLFYWYPAKCKEDQRQYNFIKSCENIHFFAMDQSEHGATLWGESIIRTLELKPEKIIDLSEKYAGSLIKPVTYCRESSGFIKATVILFGKAMRKYR